MLRSRVFVSMVYCSPGQGMLKVPRTSFYVLGRFLFGECELLFSSVFPLQPFQCSWSHVFDMDPITDAPRHCTYSVLGFSLISNKYLQTSLGAYGEEGCELPGPHLSTRLCNSSLCVSMLCFETVLVCIVTMLTNCGPFNRRSRTCLEACCKWLQGE